jgi:Uma2 family endonuclease
MFTEQAEILTAEREDGGPLTEESPLVAIPRNGPVTFRSTMTREQFHRFVLTHQEVKIERDKFGAITIYPPMTFDSGFAEGEVFYALKHWSKSNGLGRAFSPSTSFDLPDGSQYKADNAWISMERINRLSPEERKQIARIVPDFVVEVRSETDRIVRLKEKMAEVWVANGVRLAWLIDPLRQRAWVYRADGSTEEISGFGHVLPGEDVLPGFEFDLAELT